MPRKTPTPLRLFEPWTLRPDQQRIADMPERRKFLCCGRRWGKTTFGQQTCLSRALDGQIAMFASHVWDTAKRAMRDCEERVGSEWKSNASESFLRSPAGGYVYFRAGTQLENLRGFGLDYLALDEAAYIPPHVWKVVLLPALLERRGAAVAMSQPPDFPCWFTDIVAAYEKAPKDAIFSNVVAMRCPTVANPLISNDELQMLKRDMGLEAFRRECLCCFRGQPLTPDDRMSLTFSWAPYGFFSAPERDDSALGELERLRRRLPK